MTEQADAEELDRLARAAGGGDRVAFERLVRLVFARVYRWSLVRVGDPDDAEDVTQRVLLRLLDRLEAWEGRGRFTTWLYRITANEASSWRRRASRRARRLTSARSEAAPRSEAEPERARRRRLLLELLERQLGTLSPRQREVLDLIDFQGFAPAEVAEMLDMNPHTVRANLFKARRAMRRRVLAERPDILELLP